MGTKTVSQPAGGPQPADRRREPVRVGPKTVKRLVILIASFSLVGVGGYLAWSFQVTNMSRGVIAKAAIAEEKGNAGSAAGFVEAEELYREYLEIDPDDQEVQ